MSLFVERKETHCDNKDRREYTGCPKNDVHQQQNFISKGFDFSLKIMLSDGRSFG